jgi:hypothetical protein
MQARRSGMTEEEFRALRAPLERDALSTFAEFARTNGLVLVDDVGRYPRLRAETKKDVELTLWIDFWMELDAKGAYYTKFEENLPHELSGGAWMERNEEDGIVRYAAVVAHYTGRPYRQAVVTLAHDLEGVWRSVRDLKVQDVLRGRRSVIRRR